MIKILIFIIVSFSCTNAITFNCNFTNAFIYSPINYVYSCHFPILESIEESGDLTAVYGSHQSGKSNADVKGLLIFYNPALTFFPRLIGDFFPNLIGIWINNSNITVLNGDALRTIPNLIAFFMYHNKLLETVSGSFFSQMRNLTHVDLYNCSINYFEKGVFSGSNALKEINFNHNKIENIEGVFTELPALKEIYFYNNKIERLAGHFFTGSTLDYIVFSVNNIKHVADDFLDILQNASTALFEYNYCVNQRAYNSSTEMIALIEHLRSNCSDIETTTTNIPSTTTTSTTSLQPTCGDINEVICDLQQQNQLLIEKNANLELKVEQLVDDNEELKTNVEDLKIDVRELKTKNEELMAKNQKMDEKLDLIMEGILELSTRPCGI